jgi:hypothetical protein
MQLVFVRFGFEIFVPHLTRAMSNVDDSIKCRVDVAIPWFDRASALRWQQTDNEISVIRAESENRIAAIKAETAEIDKRRAKILEDSDKRSAKLKEEIDAHLASSAANLAASEAAHKKWLADMERISKGHSSLLSEMQGKDDARSSEVERDCAHAIADFLEDGRVLGVGVKFVDEFGHGDMDALVAGRMGGEDVVVVMEANLNMDANKSKAKKQVKRAVTAWEVLTRTDDVVPEEDDVKPLVSIDPPELVSDHAHRRVVIAMAGSKFESTFNFDGRPWIKVTINHTETSKHFEVARM